VNPAPSEVSSAPPWVTVERVVKQYPPGVGQAPVVALNGVSLELRAGEVVGLLGPNGAGKSTLFKLLLGLQRAEAGEVRVFGQTPGTADSRARLGYLPEDDRFPEHATISEVAEDFARLSGWRGAEACAAAERALTTVRLCCVQRRVGDCSRGMRRRLGLAAALVGEPDLLILDEPTAGLDPHSILEFGRWIEAWRRSGRSVLFCSHQLPQVEQLCDRLIFLQSGKIAGEGRISDWLQATPRSRFELTFSAPEQRAALETWCAERGIVFRCLENGCVESVYLELLSESAQESGGAH
jgi:ABC-type multidrug transport system ATPase subunit